MGSRYSPSCSTSPKILPSFPHLQVLNQIWTAPGNRKGRASAVLRAFRWFLLRRSTAINTPDKPALVQPVFGNRLYPAYADSIIAKHLMYRSEWFDWDMLHFLQSYLQPSDHFLDVGANTGLHTLLASTRIEPAAGGRITCIEPHPLNLQRLRHTIHLNALYHARVHPLAASDSTARLELTGTDVFARLVAKKNNPPPSVVVPTARLDDLIPSTPVHACKIDVEGAEWQVLRGASQLIESGHLPFLILELCGHLNAYDETESDFIDWLTSKGYRLASYRHEDQALSFDAPYPDDVFALTNTGLDLIHARLPQIKIL